MKGNIMRSVWEWINKKKKKKIAQINKPSEKNKSWIKEWQLFLDGCIQINNTSVMKYLIYLVYHK